MAGPALGHWPGSHHSELLASPHGSKGKDTWEKPLQRGLESSEELPGGLAGSQEGLGEGGGLTSTSLPCPHGAKGRGWEVIKKSVQPLPTGHSLTDGIIPRARNSRGERAREPRLWGPCQMSAASTAPLPRRGGPRVCIPTPTLLTRATLPQTS